MTLYVLKYNNYFNRKVLKEDSLSSYLTAPYYDGLHIDNVSFNPNDDIKTTQVLNFEPIGDYVICTIKTVNEGVETETIQSRWFIIESKRERTGQYTVTLKRDVLVDNYEEYKDSPIYIEKAILDNSDPYIFNKENISLNQIKESEQLLKDKTQTAWIVGYIPRNSFTSSTVVEANVPISISGNPDITVNGISSWSYYKYTNLSTGRPAIRVNNYNFIFNIYSQYNYYYKKKTSFNSLGVLSNNWGENGLARMGTFPDETYVSQGTEYDPQGNYYQLNSNISDSDIYNTVAPADFNDLQNDIVNDFTPITAEEAAYLSTLNGKIIFDSSTSIYYQIQINHISSRSILLQSLSTDSSYQRLSTIFNDKTLWVSAHDLSNVNSFKIEVEGEKFEITLSQYTAGKVSVTIDDNRGHLRDAPYDMFFMPYGDNIKFYDGTDTFYMSKESSMSLANSICENIGDYIYDLQLLPYCPFDLPVSQSGADVIIDISSLPYVDIVTRLAGTQKCGALLWGLESSFTKTIECPIEITDPKLQSQCELYRFCSPNYASAFDFDAAMNGGLDYVIVSCTYRPFNPYIQVLPNFVNLYGGNFNDSRGLICAGDFSLPRITSEWANYELSHKSSLAVFDSRISSLTSNGTNREDAISTVLGKLADSDLSQKLGNIIATPNGISNTSALNNNNKLFPILEKYSCSSEEKEAFKNKIRYEGMTVKRIGKVSDFVALLNGSKYLQGRFIIINIDGKDTHILEEINKELRRGVYF